MAVKMSQKARPPAAWLRCAGCRSLHFIHIPRLRLCRQCWTGSEERQERSRRAIASAPEGPADFCGPARLPEPTAHPPGTPEKEAVLMRRAEAGQQLHHPEDARRDAR